MPINLQDKAAIERYNLSQALLAPFKKEMDAWAVSFVHDRQRKISALNLVSTGDLESDWGIQVRTADEGVVVADFSFPEYGRFFDMRRTSLNNDTRPPFDEMEDWVERNISSGRIKYSALAERLKVSMLDPRVIRDVTWRIARHGKYTNKRRQWYNKGKEASLNDLYDRLQSIAVRIIGDLTMKSLESNKLPSNGIS